MNIILLQQSIFVVGFITGLISVFLYKYANHILGSTEFHSNFPRLSQNSKSEDALRFSENYNQWSQKQNIYVSKLNIDTFLYKKSKKDYERKIVLESEWLKNKVPITCVVFVEKLKLAVAIKDTWGQHCNHLLLFSFNLRDFDLPVINLGIKYTSSWQMLCEIMNYIWKRNNKVLNWIIFVKDDTFVVPENLRYLLAPLNYKDSYYLGHPVILWGTAYNVAQAGYVLSYGALEKLLKVFNTSEKCATSGKYWKKEDFYLGKHLASLGIQPLDTRDSDQRGIFHGFPLNVLLWGSAKPDSYYTRALYPLGPECCSDMAVTFNVAEADKMRTINYLLNNLRVFEYGIYGNRPAPTPFPQDEVWKAALREEFNLTDVDDISSDRYFQMWRKKYSEPEQFIAKNFGNVPKS